MENKKNERAALLIGFALILLVMLVTLFRSTSSSSGDKNLSQQDSDQTQQQDKNDYRTVSTSDLQKKIARGEQLTILDIRPFNDYISEHIADAVNIPPGEFPVSSKIDIHKPLVIIAASGDDPGINKTVEKLKEEKLENVSVLAGGMDAWKRLMGVTVTYGDPTSFTDQSKVSYVETGKLKEALDARAPMFIIDVREADEFSVGHIPGAKNIPFSDLEKRRSEVPSDKVVVTGMSELQEFQASVKLYDMNLSSPFVLKGAIPKWQESGFPLEK